MYLEVSVNRSKILLPPAFEVDGDGLLGVFLAAGGLGLIGGEEDSVALASSAAATDELAIAPLSLSPLTPAIANNWEMAA